ncbi:diguanylate cyclase (GGDEF)-like protein [Saccharopolyspora lacisalsi]|uniref:Diguanylate cyclase (GGDEF)-like protein n=1 Tax=Halosaccharopolyspora lacisalsi TaxID=1000566 RepID=A0A839E7E8_9PSEU|nr:GGDEF domain-containing protein [Halosaccharopolyspora lacisalsi]MBA8827835.1 diguanylate cyclase (GGDEF)-like protein [Halosaccharopolyspora lacisalsi]
MLAEIAVLVTSASTLTTSTVACRLRRQLRTDLLTGLANRVALAAAFPRACRRHRHHRVAVALGDLRRFKTINDTYGHRFGDRALTAIADRLRAVTSRGELPVRLHGDEFAVLLSGASHSEVERRVRELEEMVNRPLFIDGILVETGLDLGVMSAPAGSAELSALLASADDRMYGTKQSNRAHDVSTFTTESR